MASLFEELKRRNVIRVGLVYLFVAWLVVQVADILLESFGTPEWVMKTFIAFLGLGFPIALIFAWAFEITPEGLKKEKDVDRSQSTTQQTGRKLDYTIMALLAAGLIYFAATHDWGGEGAPAAPDQPAVAAGDERPSIAVLPFVNLSDGLSEELLNVLVRIEGLRVPSRTSSFQYKGTELDMRTIAEQLEVNHVLEGSVRKAGNRVRITAQLIDATTDEHLWSDTYDREIEDIFEIQSDIANQIVAALQSALGGIETVTVDAPTDNLEAYQLYLQGRQLLWQRMGENLLKAITAFEAALELDPNFARAWTGLGVAWAVLDAYLPWDVEETNRKAERAARHAIELDPDQAEAYAVLASVSKASDWRGAEELFLKALSLDPDDSTTRLWYGILLQDSGYLHEANEQFEYANRLDPAAGIVRSWLAENLYSLGNEESAMMHAKRASELGFADGYGVQLYIYRDRGDLAAAREAMEKLYEGYGLTVPCQDEFWAAMAEAEAATEYVACVEREGEPEGWWWLNTYDYVHLKMADEALNEIRDYFSKWNYVSTVWPARSKFLRQDSSFLPLMEELGLADYWRERGDPDLCRSVGDTFECD